MPELSPHPDDQEWEEVEQRFRLVVDCQVLAGLLNGTVPLTDERYRPILRRMGSCLEQVLSSGWLPAHAYDDPVIWRMREWNRQADFVVNQAMDSGAAQKWSDPELLASARGCNVVIFSDGGLRRPSRNAAAGWVAYVRTADRGLQRLAYEAQPLVGVTSAFAAEAIALEMALGFLVEFSTK